MTSATLTYDDLLDLYRGRGSVVELIDDRALSAVRVETPLLRYLASIAERPHPRHVFLTGNAGDGKTFAARAAFPSGGPFHVVTDASAVTLSELAAELARHVEAGDRLLVAINRGQLERLREVVLAPDVRALVEEVDHQLTLRVTWEGWSSGGDVIAIDMGLIDTLADSVLDPILDKVCRAQAGPGVMAAPTQLAFELAIEALKDADVRQNVKRVLRAVRGSGEHVTMRQLWAAFAFLTTGDRAPDDLSPLSIEDSVGARLFSRAAQGAIQRLARGSVDPAYVPQPRLSRSALLGELPRHLSELRGLDEQMIEPLGSAGEAICRAAWVHGSDLVDLPPAAEPPFDVYTRYLGPRPGWTAPGESKKLMKLVYEALELPHTSKQFPAWQRLCYDAYRLGDAATVADRDVDGRHLRVCVPQPPPAVREALADDWRPPALWLGMVGDGDQALVLRLSPKLLATLGAKRALRPTDRLALQRWLGRLIQESTERVEDELFISAGEPARTLRLARGGLLDDRVKLEWEGP